MDKEWTKLMVRHDIALFKLWQTYLVLNLALNQALVNSLSSKDLKGRGAGLKKDLTPNGGGAA